MKIGIISDTHIPRRAKAIPVSAMKSLQGVDMIIHAGDLTDPVVIDELKTITNRVEAVMGNMDPPENQFITPVKKIIEVEGFRIGVMHGWGHPVGLKQRIMEKLKPDKPDIIIFGHSHQAEKDKIDDILFINPGSPTDTMFSSFNSIAVLTINNGEADADIIKI